jgi:hypothetical protein
VERSVAKSIFRAFVGDYLLPNEKEAKEELHSNLSNKGKNLLSALFSYAPNGFISDVKLK